MAAVQTQPILNQFNDNFVRNQTAVLDHVSSLFSQRRPEVFFTPQNRARRSYGNTELARDHFRLGTFSGTGRAQKNESPFHLSTVKENGDPGDNERRDTDIEPHERAARGRFSATVRSTIKRSPADAALAQKPVVMSLN